MCIDCEAPCPTWSDRCSTCQEVHFRAQRFAATRVVARSPYFREDSVGYLYAFEVEGDDRSPIKFGITRNVLARLREVQAGSPYPLAVLAQIECARYFERMVHRYLAARRLWGEWFLRCDDSMRVVRLMQAGAADELSALVRVRRQKINQLSLQTRLASGT